VKAHLRRGNAAARGRPGDRVKIPVIARPTQVFVSVEAEIGVMLAKPRLRTIATDADVDETSALLDDSVREGMPRLMPRLYSYARYRLSREDAEDAVGAALERVWRMRGKWRPDQGSLEGWMIRVGVNAVRNETRRHRRHAVELSLADVVISSGDPTERFAQLIALQAATAQLPQRDSDLLAMKFGADLSNGEIAELLALTPGAVAVALHRSIAKLRDRLAS
jgi:RNA polymerase sigma factor (sigma-70 family)